MALNKRVRAATESVGLLLIGGAILVVLNVLGLFFYGRLDWTERRAWSLSDSSRRVAARLPDDTSITAYFTADLPPPANTTERYVRDLLSEYEAASNGKIRVRFIHPDTDEEQRQAEAEGVARAEIPVVEDDAVSVKLGFRGIVIRFRDKKEVIPQIENTEGLEYRITTALKEMTGERRRVGILTGHGGVSLSKGLSSLRDLLPLYELVDQAADQEISQDLAALLVIAPETALSETELRRINQYVMNGGSLGVFGPDLKITIPDQQQQQQMQMPMPPAASTVDTGLNRLLRAWGVEARHGLLADLQAPRRFVQTQRGLMGMPLMTQPVLALEQDPPPAPGEPPHPVTFRLPAADYWFGTALRLVDVNDREIHRTTLMKSSENSWLATADNLDIRPRPDFPQDGPPGPFPLVVALEGKLPSAFAGAAMTSTPGEEGAPADSGITAPARATKNVRVLVHGNFMFMRDEIIQMTTPQNPQTGERRIQGALAMGLNAIDWLAQEADLIAIRAKNVEDPPVEVPASVTDAENDIRDAQSDAQNAEVEAMGAAQQGDRQGLGEAQNKMETARERGEQAVERRARERDNWAAGKRWYRLGNMIGIPLLVALIGVIRWRMRTSRTRNLKEALLAAPSDPTPSAT